MVKRFVLMFFLGIFILTGCETQKEIKAKTVFENNFTLEYNTLQIKGVLKTTADGEIKVNVKKPDNLNGLEIKTKDDKITASFKGIKTTLDENKIPNTAFFTLIKRVFSNIIRSNSLEYKQAENGYKSVQKTDFGDVEIYLTEDCTVKKIGIKNQGFLLTFN
ncbi:MAG: hypothetical protein IJO19_02180 [Clostridia bacterium]|nr:hypothetical protein [Clostridia bacterium]